MDAEQTTRFCQHCADYARTLPTGEAVEFIRCAVELMGDLEAVSPLRNAWIALHHADAQLSLISDSQGRLL
jgi:hypothetical protein